MRKWSRGLEGNAGQRGLGLGVAVADAEAARAAAKREERLKRWGGGGTDGSSASKNTD